MAKILNVSLVTLREKCSYTEFFWSVFPVFSPNAGKYGPDKLRIPNTNTFYAVQGACLQRFLVFIMIEARGERRGKT